MLATLLFFGLLAIVTLIFLQQAVFGKHPDGEILTRIEQSENFRQGSFQNIEPTEVMLKEASTFKVLKQFMDKPSTTEPSNILPSVKTDLKNLASDQPVIVWFGHSSYLIRYHNFTILVDPVFSGYASPIGIFGKAFPGSDVYSVDDLPSIDLLILTHDHYDHLDYNTIAKLHPKVKQIIAPLGLNAHLEHWDVEADKIQTLDWWQTFSVNDSLVVTATPSRHFSGRGFLRGRTLWSSFVVQWNGLTFFIGGDSGYDSQFKKIGEKFGPFDIAMLETGQYGENWPLIHMMPEQVATAAQHLKAKLVLPVHWAKFALSNHAWTEPIERLVKSAEGKIELTTPMIGEPVVLGTKVPTGAWWRFE